jgi:hypothetical protein
MYGSVLLLEKNPLNKLIGPFLKKKWLKKKEFFLCCLGAFGYLQIYQKGIQRPTSGQDVWPNALA